MIFRTNKTKLIKLILKMLLIIVIVIRFLMTFKLPVFYLENLRYDDRLMINLSSYIMRGKYLGNYCDLTLIKGIVFPLILAIVRTIKIPFSSALTLLYISACSFFMLSAKKVIKNRIILTTLFLFLLFNPISYSSDAFQRVYRNSVLYIELLFFLGIILKIIYEEKTNILNYIILGFIMSVMLLTKEDSIWAIIIFIILIIYKILKNTNRKNYIIYATTILIILLNLNLVSCVNYFKYGIYTYDELRNSNFKKAYIKILQIKDDEKKDNIAITKSTFYKLAENSKVFDFTKTQIDNRYNLLVEKNQEITNGNIVWYLRNWIYQKNNFQSGKEANEYYKNLSDELDKLFEEGKLEKEISSQSLFLNIPTGNEIKEFPKNLLKAICYTASYKNMKTFSEDAISKEYHYDKKTNAYSIIYADYHNAENLIDRNIIGIEFIKNIYVFSTIIFGIFSLIIFLKNIVIKDKLNLIIYIVFISYLLIICGVTYTHTTAFCAIRYCYLCDIYILQTIFIFLNIYRLFENLKKKGHENNTIKLLESGENIENKDISRNSSI